MEEKKKSKKGLIIGIIAAVVVAGGAVATFFILNKGASAESVALDAITKTIKTKAHKLEGKVEFSTIAAAETGLASNAKVTLELNGENNNLNATSSATITISTGNTSDFVFRFDEVLQNDGVIYVKPADLTAFINSITSSYSQYLTAEPLASIVSKIKALASKISSNWWRISPPEILEALGVKDIEFTEQYNCVVSSANELLSESSLDSIASIYKDNQFLNVKKSNTKVASFTGDSYEATVDTSKLAKFWNEYVTSDNVKRLNACVPSRDTLSSVTPDELSAVSDSTVYLDIDKDHNLNGIHFSDSKSNYQISTDFRLKEGSEDLAIAAPSGAKPVTDLVPDVMEIIQSISSLFASSLTIE